MSSIFEAYKKPRTMDIIEAVLIISSLPSSDESKKPINYEYKNG